MVESIPVLGALVARDGTHPGTLDGGFAPHAIMPDLHLSGHGVSFATATHRDGPHVCYFKRGHNHNFAGDSHWHRRLHNRLCWFTCILLVRARFGMAASPGGAGVHRIGTFPKPYPNPGAIGDSHQPSVGDRNDHTRHGFRAGISQSLSILFLVGGSAGIGCKSWSSISFESEDFTFDTHSRIGGPARRWGTHAP